MNRVKGSGSLSMLGWAFNQSLRITVCLNYCPALAFVKG